MKEKCLFVEISSRDRVVEISSGEMEIELRTSKDLDLEAGNRSNAMRYPSNIRTVRPLESSPNTHHTLHTD